MKDQQADIQLLRSYLEETLSFDDVALLEKRICTEDKLAELLLELSCDEAIIREWHCSKQSGGDSIFGRSNSRRDWIPFLRSKQNISNTILTLSLIMLWGGILFFGQLFYFSTNNTSQVQTVDATEIDTVPPATNKTSQSSPQTITEGTVELLLPTGVKVHISAPATFQVTGENEMTLSRGILIADITTEEGKGFTVNTPRGRIVDLGTIFGVEVDASGTSSVQVFKGNVELFSSTGTKTPLAAGKTMRAEAGKEEWQPSEKLSEDFYTVLKKHSSNIVSLNEPTGWLGGPDGLTEVLYVMYSVMPLKERFVTSDKTQEKEWEYCTNHFAIVHFDDITQKWIFHANEVPSEFTPVATDLIFARTDFEKSSDETEGKRLVTFYQEDYGTIHGISHGYQTSDIQIRPDWSINPTGRGLRNFADYSLKGTYFIGKEK